MDDRFDDRLDAATLRDLSRRDDGPATRRVIVQVGVLLGSAAVVVGSASPWSWWPALAVHVVLQFAMFGLLHESLHGTAFASARRNAAACWFAAVWQFAPPAWMRAFHFTHHRHTHSLANDPELAGLEWMARWPHGVMAIVNATGLPILLARVGITLASAIGGERLLARALPYVVASQRAAVVRDARILLLVHTIGIVLAVTVAPGIAWLYVAAVPAHAILGNYLTCEHRGLPTEGSVLDRTRSLRAGPLLRHLLWNMPYHAEHHAYPSVPFHALPRLHERLAPQLVHRGRSVLDLHLRA